MNSAEAFFERFPFGENKKVEQAVAFIWLHDRLTGGEATSYGRLVEYFADAGLPKPTRSRLVGQLKKHRAVHRCGADGTFAIGRATGESLDEKYGTIFSDTSEPIEDLAGVASTPYLDANDLSGARRMAELYLVLHCYENSARRFIEAVLSQALGPDWWDKAANALMKRKFDERRAKEQREKWISPRGSASPLYYLDWGELLTLVRKYPAEFAANVPDLSFVELRFAELERIRNIVAHHGLLPSEDDFQRVLLSFRDWRRQIRA